MGEFYGLLIVMGIIMIVVGVFIFKNPGIMWELSLARRWYLKGGEPTELYYTNQKMGAVFDILLGVAMIILSISMSVTAVKGYVVEIDGSKFRMPGSYTELEALGYQIDSAEEIKVLDATTKNIKNGATYTVKNAKGKEIKVRFENRGEADKPATECEIIAITVSSENGPQIKLPNGVKLGMSEEDVKSVMGRGTPKGVGGSAREYFEKVNFDSYKINIVYDGNFMNKKVTSIRVEDVIY